MTEGADISFVHLGISVPHIEKTFSIGSFPIAYYGLIIGLGMIAGFLVAQADAKRRGQDPDLYLDFALSVIFFAILGARLYYVVFQWGYYKDHLLEIFNLRQGGLAIYGGVIASVITLFIFTKKRRVSFFSMADSACLGLVTGQIIGRWGNFVNCEAFGGYTDSLFAMRLKRSIVNENMISQELLDHLIIENGVQYIQVHPTFLYESLWNLGLLLFMLWYRKRKRFTGELLWVYLAGYGIGRAWIEGLRTDSLLIPGTTVAVSQALSLVVAASAACMLFSAGGHQGKRGVRRHE
ncbi:MAG: prolipoprotein diacylglyceryl transferase [Lachnospiraceae bacterium]|nr:prolipoprotein diacylglyceryl transferase [Lachnospiraceae bacterium]